MQLLLEFQGLAQECEGDSGVMSQRLKSLSTELQSLVEKQLQVSRNCFIVEGQLWVLGTGVLVVFSCDKLVTTVHCR